MAKLAECATELRAQGHTVRVVCADIATAHQMPEFKKTSIFQAPRANVRLDEKMPRPINYSSLLQQHGYDNAETLTPVLRVWLHLLATLDVDLVITDHSPTALLAAKLLMTPCVMLGTGYTIPPRSNPVASSTPWKHIDGDGGEAELEVEDKRLVEVVNQSIQALKFDKVQIKQAQELYSHAEQWVMSLPELDHYGQRDESYVVHWSTTQSAEAPLWPDTPGEKIFLSMDARSPHLKLLLEQLQKRGDPVLAVIPNATSACLENFTSNTIKVQREYVDIKAASEQSRVFINHCGHDLVYELLMQGMPSILLPNDPENTLFAYQLAKQKLGFPGPAKPSRLNIDELIESAAKNDQVWANASRLSLNYQNHESLHRLQNLIAAKLPK